MYSRSQNFSSTGNQPLSQYSQRDQNSSLQFNPYPPANNPDIPQSGSQQYTQAMQNTFDQQYRDQNQNQQHKSEGSPFQQAQYAINDRSHTQKPPDFPRRNIPPSDLYQNSYCTTSKPYEPSIPLYQRERPSQHNNENINLNSYNALPPIAYQRDYNYNPGMPTYRDQPMQQSPYQASPQLAPFQSMYTGPDSGYSPINAMYPNSQYGLSQHYGNTVGQQGHDSPYANSIPGPEIDQLSSALQAVTLTPQQKYRNDLGKLSYE